MNLVRAAYITELGLIMLLAMWDAWGDPLKETRYCAEQPARDAGGKIARRADVLREFKRLYPCPSTGRSTGPCPGWNIDHTIPLACGGCDSIPNLSWLPVEIKRCAGQFCKDRWERRVYCSY